jgi:hypothetical protein
MRQFRRREALTMEATGWIDTLPAGGTVRFDPTLRTAGDLAGAGAWPVAGPERVPDTAALQRSAA